MVVFESLNPPYMVVSGKKRHQNIVFEDCRSSVYGVFDHKNHFYTKYTPERLRNNNIIQLPYNPIGEIPMNRLARIGLIIIGVVFVLLLIVAGGSRYAVTRPCGWFC